MSKARNIADLGSNDVLDTNANGVTVTGSLTADGLTVETTADNGAVIEAHDNLTTTYPLKVQNAAGTGRLEIGTYGINNNIDLKIQTADTNRINVDTNGDIIMYKDDGTTAGVTFDASTGYTTFDGYVTVNNSVDLNGTLFPNSIFMADSQAIVFGTGSDAELSWGGSYLNLNTKGNDIRIMDGLTTKVHYDASSNSLGIGTDSPTFALDLQNNAGTNATWGRNIANLVDGETNDTGLRIASSVGTDGLTQLVAATNSSASQFGFMTFDGSAWGERMRIDSSGRLLLGTNTSFADGNSENLQIAGSGNTGMMIKSGTANYGSIYFGDATSGDARNAGIIRYFHNDNSMQFWTSEGERVRIDSNGNLIIGKTSESSNTAGHFLSESGYLRSTRNGSLQVLNRITTDGDIINFQKDGSSVGSISSNWANSTDFTLSSNTPRLILKDNGGAAIAFDGTYFHPWADNAIDLGYSANRWKDVRAVRYYGDGSNLTGVGSTTYGAVGTYSVGGVQNGTNWTTINRNDTIAGSSIRKTTGGGHSDFEQAGQYNQAINSAGLSGTWRAMSRADEGGTSYYHVGAILWVRIS